MSLDVSLDLPSLVVVEQVGARQLKDLRCLGDPRVEDGSGDEERCLSNTGGAKVNGSDVETSGKRTDDVILNCSGRSDLQQLGLSLTSLDDEGAESSLGGRGAGEVQRDEHGEEREEGEAVVVDGRIVGEMKGSKRRREGNEAGDSLDGRLGCIELELEE